MTISIRWFSPGPKVYWRGRWFDSAYVTAAKAREKAQGYSSYFYQGSYNRGVSASGGTHDKGGVGDVQTRGLTSRKHAARYGIIGWHRTPAQGFSEHEHNLLLWDSQGSTGLKAQMYAYRNGRNGLAGNGRDDSGTRSSYRHYLDWRAAVKKAAKAAKAKVPPNVTLHGINTSLKFGSQVRPYVSVKILQTALNKVYGGKDLQVDGVMGPKTIAQYNRFRSAAFGPTAAKGSIGAKSLKLLFKRAGMKVNVWDKPKSDGGKLQ